MQRQGIQTASLSTDPNAGAMLLFAQVLALALLQCTVFSLPPVSVFANTQFLMWI